MNKQIFEYHPITGYRFIPHLQTRMTHESGGYLIKANNLGFRSEIDFTEKKTNGGKRVLLFGDSFTAGDGVSNKKRFSDLLMQMLPGTEIYNFGMPGTGTDQHYLLYREFAKNIEYDLVVIVILVENIRRVNAQYRYYFNDKNEKIVFQKPYFIIENNKIILKNTPVNPNQLKFEELPQSEKNKVDEGGRFPAIRNFINKAGLKEVAQKLTHYQPLPEFKNPNNKEWLLMKAILLKWISELHTPVLLIPLPLYQYVEDQSDYKDIEQRFKELNGVPNVTLYNPLSDLKNYPLETRRRFRFEHDVHPTALGHEAYAKTFKQAIEKLL